MRPIEGNSSKSEGGTTLHATGWSNIRLVNDYTAANKNPSLNWYETQVNIPDILQLMEIGSTPHRVLDFGCGPGDFTAQLHSKYDARGADASQAMIDQTSKSHPHIQFFNWDGMTALPDSESPFDAVVSKLTLEFIADLSGLALHLYNAITPGGKLVISVMHPTLGLVYNDAIDYWKSDSFDTQIGATGLKVTKIQHSISQYINSFVGQGFALGSISEPAVPEELRRIHSLKPDQVRIPKRLNMLFVR